MTKITVVRKFEISFEAMQIDEAIHSLSEIREKYGNGSIHYEYGYEGLQSLQFVYEELETDEEYEHRMNEEYKKNTREAAVKLRKEESEKKELKRLLKKYGLL